MMYEIRGKCFKFAVLTNQHSNMKKIFFIAAVCSMFLLSLTACGSKTLDRKGIEDLTKKEKSEVTEADYDFILDQMEIVSDMAQEKSQEEILKSEDGQYILALAMMSTAVEKDGTPAQKKRLRKILEESKKQDKDK